MTQTSHDIAIDAIERCFLSHSYGTYQGAVEAMLPVYKAAPDMKAALITVLKAFRGGGSNIERVASLIEAEKAISKARGEA